MSSSTVSLTAPTVCPLGLNAVLVRFGETLTEPGNRAALAFAAAVARAGIDGVEECAPSLMSVCVQFDPLHVSLDVMVARLRGVLADTNWYEAALPGGRRFIRVPTVYGTPRAPQLESAAEAAGLTLSKAVEALSAARVRVQTIGFAPGQPYLGLLPPNWDIPRQTALTNAVPEGALVVAIRQFVLFSVSNPTGWRHIGQTALKLFRPESEAPFFLRPGDEVQFVAASPDVVARAAEDPDGGAVIEALR